MKNHKYMYILILIIAGYHNCQAQKLDSTLIIKFKDSFAMQILHPTKLYSQCIPVICLLKIQTDANSKVSNLEISDSADSLFVIAFKKNISNVDLKSFEKYCADFSLDNRTIIMPISYSFSKVICTEPHINAELLTKYNKFHGKTIVGDTWILTELSVKSKLHDY